MLGSRTSRMVATEVYVFTMCWESQNCQNGWEGKLSNEGYLQSIHTDPYAMFFISNLLQQTYVEEIWRTVKTRQIIQSSLAVSNTFWSPKRSPARFSARTHHFLQDISKRFPAKATFLNRWLEYEKDFLLPCKRMEVWNTKKIFFAPKNGWLEYDRFLLVQKT